jgi:hypothetical protein
MDLDLFPNAEEPQAQSAHIETLEGRVTTWLSEQQLADQNSVVEPTTDPYVHVERYHTQLPPLLQDHGFREALHRLFPPPTHHLPEVEQGGLFDTTQYLAVRTWVYDSLRENPDFVGGSV